jgi:hypothetical protein
MDWFACINEVDSPQPSEAVLTSMDWKVRTGVVPCFDEQMKSDLMTMCKGPNDNVAWILIQTTVNQMFNQFRWELKEVAGSHMQRLNGQIIAGCLPKHMFVGDNQSHFSIATQINHKRCKSDRRLSLAAQTRSRIPKPTHKHRCLLWRPFTSDSSKRYSPARHKPSFAVWPTTDSGSRNREGCRSKFRCSEK